MKKSWCLNKQKNKNNNVYGKKEKVVRTKDVFTKQKLRIPTISLNLGTLTLFKVFVNHSKSHCLYNIGRAIYKWVISDRHSEHSDRHHQLIPIRIYIRRSQKILPLKTFLERGPKLRRCPFSFPVSRFRNYLKREDLRNSINCAVFIF